MTRFELINNYETLIKTQHIISTDASGAIQNAWDMCMDMGRQHGFSQTVCHDCWCSAMQKFEHIAANSANDN